jgi:UDPglucose--hexose-1-phosphate uridylyltransferase
MRRQDLTVNNFDQLIKEEIAVVFSQVLEDAGVFKRDEAGKNAFLRFLSTVGAYC